MKFAMLLLPLLQFVAVAQPATIGSVMPAQWPRVAGPSSPVPDIYWNKFPNGSGTTSTATVGPNLTTDCVWVTGKSGSGFALDGNGTSQEAFTASSVSFGTNKITVAFWIFCDNVTATQVVLESSAHAGLNTNALLFYTSASTLTFHMGGAAGAYAESVAFAVTGTWVHVLCFLNKSTPADITVYLDGSLQATTPSGTDPGGMFDANTLNVLARDASSLWTDARIDDLRIYSGDRSASVTAIMNDPQ